MAEAVHEAVSEASCSEHAPKLPGLLSSGMHKYATERHEARQSKTVGKAVHGTPMGKEIQMIQISGCKCKR